MLWTLLGYNNTEHVSLGPKMAVPGVRSVIACVLSVLLVWDVIHTLFGGLSFPNWAGTYVECPLHGRNLFRHQDDIEGIHLRLREADVHIPWNPASMYMPFGSSGRRCFDA